MIGHLLKSFYGFLRFSMVFCGCLWFWMVSVVFYGCPMFSGIQVTDCNILPVFFDIVITGLNSNGTNRLACLCFKFPVRFAKHYFIKSSRQRKFPSRSGYFYPLLETENASGLLSYCDLKDDSIDTTIIFISRRLLKKDIAI